MSNIKKLVDLINDDLAWYNEFWSKPVTTTYMRGIWVDPDKFDIVPRPEYKKNLISIKEKTLKELEEQMDVIRKEIKELKQ